MCSLKMTASSKCQRTETSSGNGSQATISTNSASVLPPGMQSRLRVLEEAALEGAPLKPDLLEGAAVKAVLTGCISIPPPMSGQITGSTAETGGSLPTTS